jgi:hypothetical protein
MRRSKVTIRIAKRKCPMSFLIVDQATLRRIGTPFFLALAPTAFASPVPPTALCGLPLVRVGSAD